MVFLLILDLLVRYTAPRPPTAEVHALSSLRTEDPIMAGQVEPETQDPAPGASRGQKKRDTNAAQGPKSAGTGSQVQTAGATAGGRKKKRRRKDMDDDE